MPNWSIGRTGQLYVIEESAYGVSTTLAGSNALRHLNVNLHYDPHTLRKSPERHTHPSLLALLVGRAAATHSVKMQMYPSGTLNTVPEADLFLKNGLGTAAANVTLATTVASGSTATGATLASGTGLVVNAPVQINIASGANAGTYVRFLASVAGAVVTWVPALPGAPAVSDTVKAGVNYVPGTALTKSLDICHYPQAPAASAPSREQLGCIADKLSFQLDANVEPMLTVTGPAKGFAAAAQSQPGSFTTVGAEGSIPSGLTGSFYYNGTLYQVEKIQIDIDNQMLLQNTALGTASAVGYLRQNKRAVTVKFDAKVSDDLTAWTPSLASTANPLFVQIGSAGGKIWGVYLPNVTLNVPDTPDADGVNNWAFQGTATGVSGNDEIFVAQV